MPVYYFRDPVYGQVASREVSARCKLFTVELGDWRRRGVAVLCKAEDGKMYSGYVEFEYGSTWRELADSCFGEGDRCASRIVSALLEGRLASVEEEDKVPIRVYKAPGYETVTYSVFLAHATLGVMRAGGREVDFAIRHTLPDEVLGIQLAALANKVGAQPAESLAYHVLGEVQYSRVKKYLAQNREKKRKKAPA